MKKILIILTLILLASPVFAQTKISQMPNGGAVRSTDLVPLVRGGVNFYGEVAGPSGSTGAVQTNNGSGGFSNFLLGTTAGSGDSTGGLLLNNSGVSQALSIGTVNGVANVVTPISLAGSALYQASQGLLIDPRAPEFGAQCNAQVFSGTVGTTMGSPNITISNHTFQISDIGLNIAIFGQYGDVGIGVTTIISVTPGTHNAVIGASPTVSWSANTALLAYDDTAAFHAASVQARALGGRVLVPNNCAVRELTIANGATLDGATPASGYGYYSVPDGSSSLLQPTMYILSTGFTTDSTNYGINVTNGYAITLANFTITSITFPYLGYPGINLACVGSTNGTGGAGPNQSLLLEHMTFFNCPIAVGTAYQITPTGHMFFQSHFSSYVDNGWGWWGDQSDSVSVDDVFTGNFGGGMSLGPQGTAGYASAAIRILGTRFEENGLALWCNGCIGTHLEGVEFQFNKGWAIELSNGWQNYTQTGGFIENNGQEAYASGTGSIAGTVMTIATYSCGSCEGFQVGSLITGTGVTPGTYITSLGSGTGTTGTYNVLPSQTVSSGTTISGNRNADIVINGGPGNNTITSFTNIQWTTFSSVKYNVLGLAANTSGVNLQFLGGTQGQAGTNGASYGVAFSYFENGQPKQFEVNGIGQPWYRGGTGITDFTVNANSAVGLQTSSAQAGSILDMSGANTSANSSMILPGGAIGVRPTGIAGMVRYNSTVPDIEGYYGGQWNNLGTPPPYNYLGGLTLSNDSALPNTVIDVAAGTAASADGTVIIALPSGEAKSTAAWALGSGNGCLDSGSAAASTWYSVYAIKRTDSGVSDVLCSTSAISPTLPTNYNEFRRLGSFKTDSSSHIIAFTQVGTNFYWNTATLDQNSTSVGTAASLQTLNVPPGVKVIPLCRWSVSNTGNSIILTSGDETDIAPENAVPIVAAPGQDMLDASLTAGLANFSCPLLTTNTAQQVRARASASSTGLSIVTRGWQELNISNPGILAIDGSATGSSTTQTVVNTLTTSIPHDVIMTYVVNYSGSPHTTASISDTAGLTWTLRKTYLDPVFNQGTISVYYAIAPTTLSSDVITVTSNTAGSYQLYAISFGVSGANTITIFDNNASLPVASNTNTSTSASCTLSTSHGGSDMILDSLELFGTGTITPPSGFTAVNSIGTSNPYIGISYDIINTPLNSQTLSWTFGNTANGVTMQYCDAIKAAGP